MKQIFLIIGIFLISLQIYGQGNTPGAATDLGSGSPISAYLNQSFNVTNAGYTDSGSPSAITPATTCIGTTAPITTLTNPKDRWATFEAATTGSMVIEYTSSNASSKDAILEVYRNDGALGVDDLLNCANRVRTVAGTERVTISAEAGLNYYIRVISADGNTDMNGSISIYEGIPVNGDLCSNALEVSIGTCDFVFEVESRFYNHENLAATCAGFNPINADPSFNEDLDGWVRFEASSAMRVAVEYESFTGQSYGLTAYSGTCGNLSVVPSGACVTDGVLEFDVVAGDYYIRVKNLDDGNVMNGSLCIQEVKYRDDCSALSPALSLDLGDCNVRVNLPQSNTSSGTLLNNCNTGGNTQDVWFVYNASAAGEQVQVELTRLDIKDFDLSVYYNGGACPLSDAQRLECDATAGTLASADFTFTTSAAGLHYIRVKAVGAEDLVFNLCLYSAEKKSEDNFFTANPFAVTLPDCDNVFNVLRNFGRSEQGLTGTNSGGFPFPPSISSSIELSCEVEAEQDAWARFTFTPAANDLLIEYDNDNLSPSIPDDIALVLYRAGGTITTNTTTPAGGDNPASALAVDVNNIYEGFDVNTTPGTGGVLTVQTPEDCGAGNIAFFADRWAEFTSNPVAEKVSITFEEPSGTIINLYVYNAARDNILACTEAFTGSGLASITFDAAANTQYYIRVVVATPGITNGTLGIYTQFTEVGCINTVQETTEQLVLPSSSPAGDYFIRVVNLEDGQSETVTGTLCIREDVTVQGDICSTAIDLLVGDCDIDFTLGTDFNEEPAIASDPNPMDCGSGSTNPLRVSDGGNLHRDGWISFIATSNNTTVEYQYVGQGNAQPVDIMLAAYRGSCGSLIYLPECSDDDPDAGDIEKIKISTIVGLQYYVRVMNITTSATPEAGDIGGRLCIYNTTERDVCDDDDLVIRNVGDCNIQFDVPSDFTNTGAEFRDLVVAGGYDVTENNGSIDQIITEAQMQTCESNPAVVGGQTLVASEARDAWMKMIGNGNEVTLTYETTTENSNPVILVYTALQGVGPVNCSVGLNGAGNPDNQYACVDAISTLVPASGIQVETVTFQTNAGQVYVVRIIDNTTISGVNMEGTLCISDGANTYDTPCTAREVEIGDCSIPLNVISSVANCFEPSSTGTSYTDNSTAGCYECSEGDAWATFTVPYVCDSDQIVGTYTIDYTGPTPVCVSNGSALLNNSNIPNGDPVPYLDYNAGPDNENSTPAERADDLCECLAQSVPPSNYYNDVTIEYNNNDGFFTDATNADLAVYRFAGDCSVTSQEDIESNYTEEDCSNVIPGEGTESVEVAMLYGGNDDSDGENINPDHGEGGQKYLVRVINKGTNQSVFGDLCLFFGDDVGMDDCGATAEVYGDLEGEFRSITVPEATTNGAVNASQDPDATIPNCVIPGGSRPKSYNPPVRSDVWMTFDVPVDPSDPTTPLYDAVTVQFSTSNSEGVPLQPNPQNAAIAIYSSCSGVALDCANTVFEGAESLTFSIDPSTADISGSVFRRYYVRIMNVHNTQYPNELIGRIRVFPFAQCEEGPELVIDGDFENWPIIEHNLSTATGDPNSNGTNPMDNTLDRTIYDGKENDNIHTVIKVDKNSGYPSDLDYNAWLPDLSFASPSTAGTVNTGVVRFATEYGYLRDRTRQGNLPSGSNTVASPLRQLKATQQELRRRRNELNPEGLLLVKQSPQTVKGDWHSYGVGYSGYGKNRNYCRSGGGGYEQEPCIQVDIDNEDGDNDITTGVDTEGFYNVARSRSAPWPTTSDANFLIVNGSYNPSTSLFPGKVWCQTIQRGGGSVGYYVFTVWINNMIEPTRSLDVPQVRLTICDMEDPNTPGEFPDIDNVTTLDIGNPQDVNNNGLVDGTRLPGATFAQTSLNYVRHFPEPPTNRLQAYARVGVYGAAQYCNLDTEANNARLKPLGSSFIIEEAPDKWQVIRCIYRAPREVSEFNICIENLSLTKNGNDIGFDRISFRECESPNVEAFDRLLKGDPCELADNPSALGIPLSATLLDFSGKLIGEHVFLNWITIQEYNAAFFEVQRSFNGRDFTAIGKVDAKGNSASYDYIDKNVPTNVSTIYYRLKIIDKNGLENMGPLTSVDITSQETYELKLVPNPQVQGNKVRVEFNVGAGVAGLEIADMMGNKLIQQEVETKNGKNEVEIKTSSLKPGIYIIRVIYKGKAVSKKLLII